MKINSLSKLTAITIGASSLLYSGCASMPTPMKVALTPIAVVRDVLDVPITLAATGIDNYSNINRQRKDCNLVANMFQYKGFKEKEDLDLCQFSAELITDFIGSADYLACRSFAPGPEGKSPWKNDDKTWKEHLFPNMKAIWNLPTYTDPFTGKKSRL